MARHPDRAALGIRNDDWEQALNEICPTGVALKMLKRTEELAIARNRGANARGDVGGRCATHAGGSIEPRGK